MAVTLSYVGWPCIVLFELNFSCVNIKTMLPSIWDLSISSLSSDLQLGHVTSGLRIYIILGQVVKGLLGCCFQNLHLTWWLFLFTSSSLTPDCFGMNLFYMAWDFHRIFMFAGVCASFCPVAFAVFSDCLTLER